MIFDSLLALPGDATPWIVDHEPIIVPATDQRIAPRDIADATARTASVLKDRGVLAGKRCIVWLDSPTDVIVAYAAITALDAVPILISPTLSADTLAAMVAGVGEITTVVATDERHRQAAEVLPELTHLDWRDVAAALPGSRRFSRGPEVTSDADYVVVHTSGTTGIPKLVACSSRSIYVNARVQAVIHRVTGLRGHIAFAISPVHGRTVVGILAMLMRRAPLMLLADDSADSVERMLLRHRPTYLETHPNTFRAWQHLGPTGAFRSVRMFGAGFDVIHPDTVRELLAGSGHRFALFAEVYGQNESGPVAIRMHLKGAPTLRRKATARLLGGHSVGPRFTFCQVRILDDLGRPVPAGQPGRIVVRTPGTFSGYLNRPDIASRNYPTKRWWDTGDWGTKSRLGMMTLIDREVDMLPSLPSAIAVENIMLEQFPELLELVVLDDEGAVRPVLSVRPGAEFRPEKWHRLAAEVAAMADPIVIDDSDFPRTVTGKIKREELKQLLRARRQPVG